MTPGPFLVVECPRCGVQALQPTTESGNTFGGAAWSDGYTRYPMLPPPLFAACCSACAAFYYVEDARVAGEVELADAVYAFRSGAWDAAPWVKLLTGEQWLAALDAGLGTTRERALELRLHAWWASNDPYRDDPSTWIGFAERGPGEHANALALLDLLATDDADQALSRVELLRELGRFAEAAATAATLTVADEQRAAASRILQLAREQVAAVVCLYGDDEAGSSRRSEPAEHPAVAAARQAVDRDPRDALAHFRLGSALQGRGRGQEAVLCWERARAAAPGNGPLIKDIMRAYFKLGRIDKAVLQDSLRRNRDRSIAPVGDFLFDGFACDELYVEAWETFHAVGPHFRYSFRVLEPDGQVVRTVQLEPRAVLLEPDKTFVVSVTRNGRRTTTGVYFQEVPDYEELKSHVLDAIRDSR